MRQLAGQVQILLFALIAPNDSVSFILNFGIANMAAARVIACAGLGGPGGRMVGWWDRGLGSVAGRQWDAGGRSASAPMPSGLPWVARA